MSLNETCFPLNPMINIPIDKRREYLKKIYSALNASPIAYTYTPEKVKDIAITSEYECCENSKSEPEYHTGIAQIIKRIMRTSWEAAGRPLKQRPTVISNPQVIFDNSMEALNAFGAVPAGARMHKTPPCHTNRQEVNANVNMYPGRALDPCAKTGSIPAAVFSRYRYPHSQTESHLMGQEDFMPQYVPGMRGYQTRDCTVPPFLRHHEAAPNMTQVFRRWDMHDRNMNRLNNIRVPTSVRGTVPHNFEDMKSREKCNNAGKMHMPSNEASIPIPGDVLRFSPFICAADGAERSGPADADVFQRNTKEDVFKAPYSYTCVKRELQSKECSGTAATRYADSACNSYRPQRTNMLAKLAVGTDNGTQSGHLQSPGSISSEVLEFDMSKKLADVAIGDGEKAVIRNKLAGFQKELLAIEDDVARHAKLGCSPDLNRKLATTCRIIHTQMEYISEGKYFLREVFVDVAIEKVRKYVALIRSELDRAHKDTEVYDFANVCEKVRKAFRKMKSIDPNFVFCIDPY